NFMPGQSSSAIDNANASVAGWPTADLTGHARFDEPTVANSGAGSVTFADRGAVEFFRNLTPVAGLSGSPLSGIAPLAVTFDASASSDPDDGVASYQFDFGDGTVLGPQS